jgi:nitrous oxidase accessory protein
MNANEREWEPQPRSSFRPGPAHAVLASFRALRGSASQGTPRPSIYTRMCVHSRSVADQIKKRIAAIPLFAPALALAAWPPLQPLVDATPGGGTLTPPPGTYAGPVVVNRPMTIDGAEQVTIDGGGTGTLIVLATDGATLKGLRLRNSGSSHNDLDSGVQVRGRFNVIRDNTIEDCLFGVDLQQSRNNIVRHNRISSKAVDLGVRGDAVRLWYSFDNQITDNEVRHSRDIVVWYSRDNLIARNDTRGGRYSLHFMYSQTNRVEDNRFEDNGVGIFLMYSDGVEVRRNIIARAQGTTGVGIGFKETSDVTIEDNQILYCATGLYLDVSPYQPDTENRIRNNLIAYNGVGVRWLNDWQGNRFTGNRFVGNISQLVVEDGKGAARNLWEGNLWDDYEGFDRDRDGTGDRPYELYAYADRLWMDVPAAQFFKGTPLLETLDFLERLAPFSPPRLMVRDARPLMMTAADRAPPTAVAPRAPPPAGESGAYDALDALRKSLGRD